MRNDDIDLQSPPPDDRPGDLHITATDPDARESITDRPLTWHGKRRSIVFLSLGVAAVGCSLALAFVPATLLFKPGALSKPHAQILAGTVTQHRCAGCHSDSSLSVQNLIGFQSDDHHDVSQTQLCLECHQKSISPKLATTAHNLPLSIRDDLTHEIKLASSNSNGGPAEELHRWFTRPAVDQNNLQCSVCHKEHHGTMNDLTAMSNQQCQTCHAEQFDRLAGSHPDWDQWPYGRGGEIAFDHGTHSAKHFPSKSSTADGSSAGSKFECQLCHRTAGEGQLPNQIVAGELTRSLPFEASCASCHADSLKTQLESELELVMLPVIPEEVANAVGHWPDASIGFVDGKVSPFLELLLRSDKELATFLKEVPAGDLSRLDDQDPVTQRSLIRLATAVQRLLDDFAATGHIAVQTRLEEIGLRSNNIVPLLRSLPPQLIQSARQTWGLDSQTSQQHQASTVLKDVRLVQADQSDLTGAVSTADPLLDDLLLQGDPLIEQTPPGDGAAEPESISAVLNPEDQVSHGGWYRDDLSLSIRYRGAAHADAVVVAMIGTFAQLEPNDPLKHRFFGQTAIASCVSCHRSIEQTPVGWKVKQQVGRSNDFTKFSHRPHLNVSALGKCDHCHQINADDSHNDFVHDFLPLERQRCAACHTAQAAGDNCTQCHRYHIQW